MDIKVEKNMEYPKTILDEFIDYFKLQWLQYFNKEILNLKGIYIKFRSNNCLENFNRQLKRRSIRKYNLNLVNYVDLLISEVMDHEEYIISETKKLLQKLSQNKLNNNDVNLEENVEYLEIADDILNYSFENDNLESEEKNIDVNLNINNNNEDINKKSKENIILDNIYKNYNLTSDI